MELLGTNEAPIFSAQTHGLSALLIDLRHNLFVHFPAKNHLYDIHRRFIRQTHSFDKFALYAHLVENPINLGTAAVNNHRIQPRKFQQRNIACKIGF